MQGLTKLDTYQHRHPVSINSRSDLCVLRHRSNSSSVNRQMSDGKMLHIWYVCWRTIRGWILSSDFAAC